ncbi:MAG TPA: hypothetical protein PKH44_08930, partial [Plasticicumulans sp.]|nr:hypothetical protein [Plasticicumulans sp.]
MSANAYTLNCKPVFVGAVIERARFPAGKDIVEFNGAGRRRVIAVYKCFLYAVIIQIQIEVVRDVQIGAVAGVGSGNVQVGGCFTKVCVRSTRFGGIIGFPKDQIVGACIRKFQRRIRAGFYYRRVSINDFDDLFIGISVGIGGPEYAEIGGCRVGGINLDYCR